MNLIPVSKNGEYAEVHPTCLAAHKALGWRECDPQVAIEADKPEPDQFDAMSRDELKAFLTERAVEFGGNTGDSKLRSLCRDASR